MKKLIVLLTGAMLLYGLGSFALIDPSEGYYAEGAREMVESGNWLIPHLDYYPWFEKPILIYWLISSSYSLFGVSEFASRLPSALSAIFMVIVFFLLVSRFLRERAALLSTFVLVSSPLFFVVKSLALTDMVFSSLCCAAALCFFTALNETKRSFLYSGYFALGFAVLCKGPLAVVLLGMWFLLYLAILRRKPELILESIKRLRPLEGLAVVLFIAAPWFIAVHFATQGAFTREFFIDQNFGRLLTKEQTHSSPMWFYIPFALGGMFPWSIFLLMTQPFLFRVLKKCTSSRQGKLLLFSVCAATSGFFLFSLAGSKLPTYILPIFPFMAIVVGILLDYCIRLRMTKLLTFYFTGIMLLKLGGFIGVALVVEQLSTFISNGIVLSIICLLTTAIVLVINARGRVASAIYAHTAFTAVCVCLLVNFGFFVNDQINHRALKEIVSEARNKGIVIATYLRDSPAAVFYYKDKILDLETPYAIAAFAKNYDKEHCWLFTTVKMTGLQEICPKSRFLKMADKWYVYELH